MSAADVKEFSDECLQLKRLKHLDISAYLCEEGWDILQNLFGKLDSVYYKYYRKGTLGLWPTCKGLKKLLVPLTKYYPEELIALKNSLTCELILVNDIIPAISSSLRSNGFNRWILFEDSYASVFLKLSPCPRVPEAMGAIQDKGNLKVIFQDCYYSTDSHSDLMQIASIPDLVEQCIVYRIDTLVCRLKDLCPQNIPCIELNLDGLFHLAHQRDSKLQASKLTLGFYHGKFSNLFQWAINSFPNLQHLSISNTISKDMLPLQPNSLPNLTHFYSKAPQSDLFWPELLKAAPTLFYIHSATIHGPSMEEA
ncbi:hypothetical protein DSO57_1028776 [Entomophthora muscae]|uniref:Uncharacterized protein n=1 Tax=Entomophthora muscae TaxID=34485 RepID=A0ACC2U016_9FUNG|nr:hypothetical protein DSO57_1028776 [Entomophthora muscae]